MESQKNMIVAEEQVLMRLHDEEVKIVAGILQRELSQGIEINKEEMTEMTQLQSFNVEYFNIKSQQSLTFSLGFISRGKGGSQLNLSKKIILMKKKEDVFFHECGETFCEHSADERESRKYLPPLINTQ